MRMLRHVLLLAAALQVFVIQFGASAQTTADHNPPIIAPSSHDRAPREIQSTGTAILSKVFRLEHFVPVAPGRRIHLIESFTLRSLIRTRPRRAILMLPGPVTTAEFYNIPVEGYDGGAIMARRGFYAFSADLEGSGLSTYPPDGREATLERNLANMGQVLSYIRAIRRVPKVDVLGESWGGGIAAELARDTVTINKCVIASIIYKTPSDLFRLQVQNPTFRAFLDSLADGYWPLSAPFYEQFVFASPTDVRTFAFATQPGRYATAPEYAVFNLPFFPFEPRVRRAPGLIINGQLDPNQPAADTTQLAKDYGESGAALVFVPNAGHVPRVEVAPRNEFFWNSVIAFLDP
jgi:pimeloyl-ACP methyl ester carboxylesterase